MGIDQKIEHYFEPLANKAAEIIFYSVPFEVNGTQLDIKLILVWLVLAACFFTLYLGFANIRYLAHAIGLVFEKDSEEKAGEISRFKALATSLSGTVGLGNIAGVAVAVSVGGAGAIFWMICMGFISMSTKFVEVTLGVKYRKHPSAENPEKISGGPMYYLRDAFDNRNIPYLGRFFSMFFAFCCVLGVIGAGSLFQTNQVYGQLVGITGGEASFFADKAWLFGIIMLILVALVIIGGIQSIAAVTSKIVPAMGLLYAAAAIVVLVIFYKEIPGAIKEIVQGALTPEAGFGAVVGALIMGVQRAVFSNEAGLGTAAIAHSAAHTDEPVTQGLVGMLGPLVDTILICTLTGLVIVVTGAHEGGVGMEGVELTSRAFESGVSWFPYVLFAVVFLFAYSTLISWSYYGVKAFTFLFGTNKYSEVLFKVGFCLSIIVGASSDLKSVILFTDSMVFAMAIPNIIGLYVLAPEIRRDLKDYAEKRKLQRGKS